MRVVKFTVYALLGLAVVGTGGFAYLGQSSKSGSSPGLVEGKLAPCPASPNCASSEAGTEAEKRVEPFSLDVWEALPETLAAMGGSITRQDETYISAEFTSSVFGFVDDVEFRLADDAVHIRSASRVGYSDAGVNAARIAELRKSLAE